MLSEGPGLFDSLAGPRGPLAEKLSALAREGIYFGGSSWKYEGWLGQIYTRERYLTRGRFSKKKFEQACLTEYAETFPVVCGDFSFYQFPSRDYWGRLFASAPESFRMAFKVPETITVKTWPSHARYGGRSGLKNESFLDAELIKSAFLEPLEEHAGRVAALILEFGTFSKSEYEHAGQFVDDLDRFLAALPPGFRYSIEIRNREFLGPAYQQCLRSHNVAHVFNSWTRMPPLETQIAHADNFTADFTVTRALLHPGRNYQAAVAAFAPYDRIQDPYPEAREAMRELARRARHTAQPSYIFVNNRFEGNSPLTIEAVVDAL